MDAAASSRRGLASSRQRASIPCTESHGRQRRRHGVELPGVTPCRRHHPVGEPSRPRFSLTRALWPASRPSSRCCSSRSQPRHRLSRPSTGRRAAPSTALRPFQTHHGLAATRFAPAAATPARRGVSTCPRAVTTPSVHCSATEAHLPLHAHRADTLRSPALRLPPSSDSFTLVTGRHTHVHLTPRRRSTLLAASTVLEHRRHHPELRPRLRRAQWGTHPRPSPTAAGRSRHTRTPAHKHGHGELCRPPVCSRRST